MNEETPETQTEKWRKFREQIEPEIDAKRPKTGQEDWGNEPLPPKEKKHRKTRGRTASKYE